MYLNINNKQVGPYLGIMSSDNAVKGDILEIIYDNAIIELYKNKDIRYTLAYKKSKNLLGQEIKYRDIVNEITGEIFSFQVKNIFLAKIIDNDLKILALVGDEIKLYENFGKSEKLIEIDGDKKEITPLGYYDIFVNYDDKYYYPLILNEKIQKETQIKRFYDYFGYKAYEDDFGNEHLIMLIEHEKSSDVEEIWYFVDNFSIISPKVDFQNDTEYVEEWDITANGDIFMTVTSGEKWYLDKNQNKFIKGNLPNVYKTFTFTRIFEDTNGDYIVGKNDLGCFIINRTKTNLTDTTKKSINYFCNFLFHKRYKENSFFLMENKENEIVLVNENSYTFLNTDLDIKNEVLDIIFKENNLVEFLLKTGEKRVYLIGK